jgi:hypothetical protein
MKKAMEAFALTAFGWPPKPFVECSRKEKAASYLRSPEQNLDKDGLELSLFRKRRPRSRGNRWT